MSVGAGSSVDVVPVRSGSSVVRERFVLAQWLERVVSEGPVAPWLDRVVSVGPDNDPVAQWLGRVVSEGRGSSVVRTRFVLAQWLERVVPVGPGSFVVRARCARGAR